MYWLELLKATEYLSQEEFNSMYQDAEEIFKNINQFPQNQKENPLNDGECIMVNG